MNPAAKRRIFVVDDEATIARTVALILSNRGFEAIAFTDPLEALNAAEFECPDFLVTDVMMPQLNGVDLGLQFKAIHPNCKVLLFSGNLTIGDLLTNAKNKGHSFELLAKPVHPDNLLAAIEALGS